MYNSRISKEIVPVWKHYGRDKKFVFKFTVSMAIMVVTLLFMARYITWVNGRAGTVIYDPLLSLFSPLDFTWITFAILWASVTAGVIHLARYPENFLVTLQAYTLITLSRALTIYLLPLEPPASMIPLIDPFVEYFGNGIRAYNDLFFSGHTATMTILFLTAASKKMRIVFLACVVLIGAAVLLQHVHYTIDVLAAPFFAFGCYYIIMKFNGYKNALYSAKNKK